MQAGSGWPKPVEDRRRSGGPGYRMAALRLVMPRPDVRPVIEMLDSTRVAPIRWRTFGLTGEPIDEPLEQMRQVIRGKGPEGKVRILFQGESIRF